MSELTKEKIYKKELIKAGGKGNSNIERIRSLASGGCASGGGASLKGLLSAKTKTYIPKITVVEKEWNGGLDSGGQFAIAGYKVWTDGENIYYDGDFVLNVASNTWEKKTWNIEGRNTLYGEHIWTDGENIYCSVRNQDNLILNKETNTWEIITFNGFNAIDGCNVWTDGENIYYNDYWMTDYNHSYIFNKDTKTWTTKTWNGISGFMGQNIWYQGENIYYFEGTNHYFLDKTTSTWNRKNWIFDGVSSNVYGTHVWTDGYNIYYGISGVLDIGTETWKDITFENFGEYNGNSFWTDGIHIYYTLGSMNSKELIFDSPIHK